MRVGTAHEVAELLRVSDDKVYELAQSGELPSLRRIGSRLRFDMDEVEQWQPPQRQPRPKRARYDRDGFLRLTTEQAEALPVEGHVYFIQPTAGGPIKIGLATHVAARFSSIQSGSPVPLRLLATIPGGRREEYRLHRRFAAHRLHGEWFSPDAPGLAALIRKAAP